MSAQQPECLLVHSLNQQLSELQVNQFKGCKFPEAEKTILLNNIPVAYAVTYLVGTTILVWFLSSLAPKLMKIDLRSASRELEKKLLGKTEDENGLASAFEDWRLRAFKITNAKWVGLSIGDIEKHIVALEYLFIGFADPVR